MLVGSSRKGFISRVMETAGRETQKRHSDTIKPVAAAVTAPISPDQREWGTAATVAASILGGADIVRVHDVAAMRAVRDVTDQICHK